MKDSGIPWVGEIPSEWEVGRIGGLYKHRNQKVSDADFPPLSVTMKGVVPQLETAAKTDDHDNRKLVKVGDFAINSRSDRRGSCGVSAYDGSVSLINTVLEPREAMCPAFYNLLFHTTEFADEFYKWGHGIVDDLWTTRWQDMKAMKVPLPSIDEQQRIAEYLDRQCVVIDEVKRTIEDEVEALRRLRKATIHRAVTKGLDEGVPMLDSGVDWIGEIPSSWTTMPLKQICTFGKGLPITKADLVDEGLPVVSYGQIHSKKNTGTTLTSDLCRHVEEKWLRTNKSALASKDDFLFADTSEDYEGLGNCAFVDTDGLVFAGYHTIIARPHGYSCPKYLAYLFRTDCWRKQIRENASGVKVFSATQSIFKRVSILVPTTSEQQRIADYLDERCVSIDSVIDTRTRQLERLDDYRRALIFAYVTGKKEIPSHE